MTNQTNIPQVYQRTKELMRSDEIQARFREILDKNAPAFIASVLNTLYLSDYLRDSEPNSVIISALTAAALGLPVDNNLGFAYLVPYREKGVKIARFQLGWRGYVQLAQRSGQYRLLNATEIYAGQEIRQNQLTGQIVLNGNRTGDQVIGYVAYFQLVNGFEKFIYMTIEEVTAHAKRYSKSYGDPKSAWTTNFDEMAKKTVVRRLLSKYGPLSIQMQQAIHEDREPEQETTSLYQPPTAEAPPEDSISPETTAAEPETPKTSEAPTLEQAAAIDITQEQSHGVPITLEEAESLTTSKGTRFGDLTDEQLRAGAEKLAKLDRTPEQERKLLAMQIIVAARKAAPEPAS